MKPSSRSPANSRPLVRGSKPRKLSGVRREFDRLPTVRRSLELGFERSCKRPPPSRSRCTVPSGMDVGELELPEFDPADTRIHGDRFHQTMTVLAEKSWLARIPLGYMTLDREAGEFFL